MIMDAAGVVTVPLMTATVTDMTSIMTIDMITSITTDMIADTMTGTKTDTIIDVVITGTDTIAMTTGVKKHKWGYLGSPISVTLVYFLFFSILFQVISSIIPLFFSILILR